METTTEHVAEAMGVPLLLCDRNLCLLHMSAEARTALELSDGAPDQTLPALVRRLPSGAELVQAAERALAAGETQELTIRTNERSYLARVSASTEPSGGVAIVFSDVTALQAATARAVAQQHQQAAVARLGAYALSLGSPTEVFEEALSALFGNIPVCCAGVILERPSETSGLQLVASRGFGADPLGALEHLGAHHELLQAVLERGAPVLHSQIESGPASPSISAGIACPILDEGSVLGIIALYARRPGIHATDHRHFMQAIANVLGGAIARQRTRRRLSLELEVSTVLGSASDLNAMCSGVAHALRSVLPLDAVEVWLPGNGARWVRAFPECAEQAERSSPPAAPAEGARVRYQPARAPGEPHELTIAVRSGSNAAVVRVLGTRLNAPDPDLAEGLRRSASMLGDFLDRLSIMQALVQSEASYRRRSEEFESLYASLQRVEANLRETDRQKDDFLALLGHELRNPMAAIRNATELLGRLHDVVPQIERLQHVFERQTLQMAKLIDGLLDVARVARGKVELQITPLPIGELVRQVVDDRREQFRDREVELHLPEESPWIAADRVRIVQILDNLLSNAHKFTVAGGHIGIALVRSGARCALVVSDDGMGIDPDVLPRVFEPFRQGRGALAHGGLGLGLALVKGLVDLHGFQLHVHSEGPGCGAVFRIDFPLREPPECVAPESRVEMRALDLLLVEDNADIADTLAELLVASGHEVESVGSAEQALRVLRARRPDVVLCDIGLPGMDGMELAALLRAEPALKDLKLVAMTGYSDATTRTRVEGAGFDRLLIKPVELDALSQCLARLAAPARALSRR
jgi:signal transduction histidine kinase/CheY-like chemotaxis protein